MQGRNVVLESKFGSPRIVNDGVTVAKEVELEDPVENIGAKLVRQVRSYSAIWLGSLWTGREVAIKESEPSNDTGDHWLLVSTQDPTLISL